MNVKNKSIESVTTHPKGLHSIFKDFFDRKYIREINFKIGSITFRECVVILFYIFLHRKTVVSGGFIKDYEDKFAKYVGAKYAFSFGAGRMALYAILKALGIKEGDEVILPAYTCVVVPNAVIYCGAKPIYVDVNPLDFCIDVHKIEEKISLRTKAIIAQHTFAAFCEMEAITKIAKKYNLKVIEDCAHALGAEYKGKKAGNFSDAAFFTMEQSKIISTWMGGIAVTNEKELADELRQIQSRTELPDEKTVRRMIWLVVFHQIFGHSLTSFIGKYFLYLLYRLNVLTPNLTFEEMTCRKPEKYPIRLSNIQASLGLSQLRKIDANIKHRRQIARMYEKRLRWVGATVNERTPSYDPVYIRYTFLVRDREKLEEEFQKNQIELGEWFNSPIHPRGSSFENAYYCKGSCPVAEFLAEHSVNLPTHPKIKMKDANRVLNVLNDTKELLEFSDDKPFEESD